MSISDELIACYIEGSVSIEEQTFVREYLSEHTEEYERILYLMDNDICDYLCEQIDIPENCIPVNESSISDIAYSAAAFATEQNKKFIPKNKPKISKTNDLYNRLNRINSELKDVL